MDCSTPGFPAHHQLPELAQTQVHGVSDEEVEGYYQYLHDYNNKRNSLFDPRNIGTEMYTQKFHAVITTMAE